MKTVYIYTLSDPRTHEIRYVGKTVNIEKRYREHLNEYKSRTYKEQWIHGMKKIGMKPILEVLDIVNDEDWCYWEKWWICMLKTWGIRLTNIGIGGEGGTMTEETKKKLSEALKGKQSRLGSKWSEEQRDKTITSLVGRKLSEEHTKKIAASNTKEIDLEKLKAEYEKDNSYERLCEIFSLSKSKIYRALRDNGLTDDNERYSDKRLSGLNTKGRTRTPEHTRKLAEARRIPIDLDRLAEEYRIDRNAVRLCEIFKIGRSKLYAELKRAGLTKRAKSLAQDSETL